VIISNTLGSVNGRRATVGRYSDILFISGESIGRSGTVDTNPSPFGYFVGFLEKTPIANHYQAMIGYDFYGNKLTNDQRKEIKNDY